MKPSVIILLLVLLTISACDPAEVSTSNEPNLRTLSAAENQVSSGINGFAFDLFQAVRDESPGNSFLSPLSVSMALGMTMNGASPETQQGIINTIDFGSFTPAEINQGHKDLTQLLLSMDKRVNLGIANSVWYNDELTLKKDFANTVSDYYDGTVKGLDFTDPASKDQINGWVETKTNGKIKNLISAINPEDVMFLVNAIYFKGDWKFPFDKSKTEKAPFTRADKSTTEVDMMFCKAVDLSYHLTPEGLQVVDIPYGNGQFRFTLFMPLHASEISGLLATLDVEQYDAWLSQTTPLQVELMFPRFKMTWKNDLKETLIKMGMPVVGFPHLFEEPASLMISKVIHQTYLDVNEAGTEAAAATAVGISYTSTQPPQPLRIVVNRPFFFVIREEHSGAILFMGQMADPEAL